MINELGHKIYRIEKEKNGAEDNLLLIIEEEVNGKPHRKHVIGWEYRLWYTICERGGLAEAGELIVKGKKVTIEEYVAIYRTLIANALTVKELIEDYSIKTTAWVSKAPDVYTETAKETVKNIGMVMVDEDNERTYYERLIPPIRSLSSLSGCTEGYQFKTEYSPSREGYGSNPIVMKEEIKYLTVIDDKYLLKDKLPEEGDYTEVLIVETYEESTFETRLSYKEVEWRSYFRLRTTQASFDHLVNILATIFKNDPEKVNLTLLAYFKGTDITKEVEADYLSYEEAIK